MRVYLGNTQPHEFVAGGDRLELPGPAVTTWESVKLAQDHPDDPDAETFDPTADPQEVTNHLLRRTQAAGGGIVATHLPENSALVKFATDLPRHTDGPVGWVATRAEGDESPGLAAEFARFLGVIYECPVGMPTDVEDTHHTDAGPPGVVNDPANALVTQEA